MMEKLVNFCLFLLLLRLSVAQTEDDGLPAVSRVTPSSGSLAGGMKCTLFGQNFASDQYTVGTGNENKGNKVTWTNGVSDIPCDVFKEDSTQRQIVCYTRRGMEADVTYWPRVKVNDDDIPLERLCNNQPYGDDCRYTPNWWNTPLIEKIEPPSGIPGSFLVNLTGKIISTRYGSDQENSANGRTEKILRLYDGSGVCQLKDGDDFYGRHVEEDSFNGFLTCKPNGTFVGNGNMTIMIEPPFGRSVAQGDQLRVAAGSDEIYMIQYYTVVSSVEPSEGSTEGGLTLRIVGLYYEKGGDDSTYEIIRINIGDTPCEVTNVVKDEYAECTVAKQPAEMPNKYTGGRGVNVEFWNDGTYGDPDALKDAAPTTDSEHFDMTKFCGEEINAKQTRMIGRFIPSKSGYYAFQVKASYRATLYFDGMAQATSTGQWESGNQMMLVKDQSYQLMVAAMGPASNPGVSTDTPPCVEASAKFFSTQFTSAWTGNAFQEEHIIRLSSTRTPDVQRLSFSGSTGPAAWTAQVQKICIEGASFDIRIGMFGGYTETVGVDSASKVEIALNKLPFLDEATESFSVEQINEQCITVTFNSARGNFSLFEVVGEGISSAEVETLTPGVPDNDFVSLDMGGRPSKPFRVSELDEAKFQAAVDSMFETTCPKQFSEGSEVFESFEGDPSLYKYGEAVNTIEAYCGRKSIKNPRKLYPFRSDDKGISLRMMQDFHVCFAYSGLTNPNFAFKYRDSEEKLHWHEMPVIPLQNASDGNIWSYGCVHPYDTIKKGELIEAKLDGVYEEFFVDALSIGPKATFESAGPLSDLRLRPASPGRQEPVLIDHADVMYDDSSKEYVVTLYPLECGHDFGLFELLNNQGDSLSGETGSTTLSGGSTTMSVTRTQQASPPLQGTFRVTFQGQESADMNATNTNATNTNKQIRDVLQDIQYTGTLDVEQSKGSNCANADIHVTFRTQAGDQELMMLSYQNMTAPPTADVDIVPYRDGHLLHNPIMGDYIFTEHDLAQVRAFINGIPCYCSGDCSFQWSAAATPTVTSLNKDSGTSGDVLEIPGTKFSELLEENAVMIGGAPCVVTASTPTLITCTVGEGSGSNQPVLVTVAGKGKAAGTATFSYVWGMTSIEPSMGSFGGGMILTAHGSGFPKSAAVEVDGIPCRVKERTPSRITCNVPPSNILHGSADRPVAVEVIVPDTIIRRRRGTSGSTFSYSSSQTGLIETLTSPATLSVKGGDTITATGTQFGTDVTISIGNQPIQDYDRTDSGGQTTLTFETPSGLPPGDVDLCLDIDGSGCAVDQQTNTIPSLTVMLEVTGVSPTHGSQLGGTVITITGGGFGTVATDVEVTVGSHICTILTVTDNTTTCQIVETAHNEIITNSGTNGYDTFYALDKNNVVISVGDTVTWKWDASEYIVNFKFGIYEVVSESSTEMVVNGINSGVAIRSGTYKYQFTQPGIYHYWSGNINSFQSCRGKVTITDKASTAEGIVVQVSGQEATYVTAGSSVPPSSDVCSVTSVINSCKDPIPVAPDSNTFYFIFSSCYTPLVDDLTFTPAVDNNDQAVTTSTEFTVKGDGFASESCAIEVKLGEGAQACSGEILSGPKESEFLFRPESACTMPAVAISKEISVLVKDRGYALILLNQHDRSVAFLPSITGVTPNLGSTAGSTDVIIVGTGLQDVTSVTFNDVPALSFNVVNDTLIECVSPKSTRGPVAVAKDIFPGVCDITGGDKCDFKYTNSETPKVDNVVPTSVGSINQTDLIFTGANFGTTAADVTVFVGGERCSVVTVLDDSITCSVEGLPAGDNDIDITIAGLGKGQTTQTVTGVEDLSSLSQSSGSKYGGQHLLLIGHGFHKEGTTVSIDEIPCDLTTVTLSTVVCVTPAHDVGLFELVVNVSADSINFPKKDYEYTSLLDGVDVSPKTGVAGEDVTISGSNFGTDFSKVSVEFDAAECVVNEVGFSDSQFTCQLGSHSSGPVFGSVLMEHYGLSNTFGFTYTVVLNSVVPVIGDEKGNQLMTLQGNGFSDGMEVTVCNEPCLLDSRHTPTPTEIVCITPAGTGSCDVSISDGTTTDTLPSEYTYGAGLSPIITLVNPQRGGTGGGSRITISGSGFGTDPTAVTVTLEGNDCVIDPSSFSDTEIQCDVPAHSGTIETDVIVTKEQKRAVEDSLGASKFWYIDAWSSTLTWGGGPLPEEGDLIVVPKGQNILLDTDTPVLAQLLIKGGQVIFDCSKPVELKSKYIFITDGGMLQIGTENKPCLSKAIITLYGHQRSLELPVFGSKVLALQEGFLELHGKPIPTPWTRLSQTALAGSSEIRLPINHITNWAEEDDIVIATTGDRHSQAENEKHTIKSIHADGEEAVLTLTEALAYTHTGVDESYGDGTVTVEFRAEVGLLTRTVVVRGSKDEQWNDPIEKCPAGFDTGEHTVQTCFQGRFGEEMGSDQFGATIMIHQRVKDTQVAIGHIEYVEVTNAGQAFHLGRYPIHMHLNGDMSKSYVIGCAIHMTFNRAVNVHNTHNLRIQWNVAYNIMGGAFFLEDGIEIGNIFEYNLAVFVKASTSLLNDDLTPAAFWVTNPNNTLHHNTAAGGSHFGYWYRMHEHPDGPSYTDSYCPRRVPLGEFYNNSAHSCGWFGVWTFQEWQPQKDGRCHATVNNVELADFRNLTVWNCEKGFESVDAGSLQITGGIFVNNKKSGIEGIKLMNTPKGSENSPTVRDTWIVGHTDNPDLLQPSHGVTSSGIVVPFGVGYRIINVWLKNLDESYSEGIHFAIRGLCPDQCGGFDVTVSDLHVDNVNNLVKFRWQHEAVLIGIDDSLTGTAMEKVLPINPGLPPSCVPFSEFNPEGIEAAKCPGSLQFHRWASNHIYPTSLEGKDMLFTNQYGNISVPFRVKRFTHKEGWMAVLVDGETYIIEFQDASFLTNISMTVQLNDYKNGSCNIFKIRAYEEPDRFSLNGGVDVIEKTDGTSLDCATASHGNWVYDGIYVHFAIVGPSTDGGQYPDDIAFDLTFYKCFFEDCQTPVPDDYQPLDESRPDYARYWDEDVWTRDQNNVNLVTSASNASEPSVTPEEGNDVTISKDDWIVIRQNKLVNSDGPFKLGTVLVLGKLEVSDWTSDSADTDYSIFVNFIIIKSPGRFLAGWPDLPFVGAASINLVGTVDSPYYSDPTFRGGTIGAKTIGVFGGLDLIGKNYGEVWTLLATTANPGDTILQVAANVSLWPQGGELIVTTTSYNTMETEKMQIQSVTDNTITLAEPLAYRHVGSVENVNGVDYTFSAAVALLTRNIKIRSDPNESASSYGGRVFTSIMQDTETLDTHTGYARLINVEFQYMGQEGFTEEVDARYALVYSNTGEFREEKPSIVYGCSFDTSYNTAIGVYGTENLNIENNVVHKTVGNSFVLASTGSRLIRNLAANMLSTASYNGREEEFNSRYEVSFDLFDAKETIFESNYAVASERGGYHLSGEAYDPEINYTYDDEKANVAVGNLMGVQIFPEDIINREGCNLFHGMKFWRNVDYAFYYNNINCVIIDNMVFADNQVAVLPFVIGPSSLDHLCDHKKVEISNCVVMGHTSSSDCSSETSPSGTYYDLSDHCRGRAGPGGEKLGILPGQFTEGSNKAPEKPCANVKKSNSVCGSTTVKGVTFKNFGTHDTCPSSFATATNPSDDDLQHLMTVSDSTMIDIEADFEILINRPNLRKINPADCVDFDCDAFKKFFLQDSDGSFLGAPGYVIPDAGWEWNGDPRRGLGDYRIPLPMQTEIDGTRIDINDVRDIPGIPRVEENCRYVYHEYSTGGDYGFYKCTGGNTSYKMLVIESLDSDTMTRRLAPVAVRQSLFDTKFIDLINGPQDHGCCSGYLCQRRLSTFHSVVAVDSDEVVDIYLTSTSPDKMRFLFVDPDETSCVVISFYYSKINRIDVFTDDGQTQKIVSNGRMEKDRLILDYEKGLDHYMPTCADEKGTNFIDRDAQLIYFVLKGTDRIWLKRSPQVIISLYFPTLTIEEVYGERIIEYMAAFLGVPPEKVRIVKIVAASGSRRKRSTGSTVEAEIGDVPAATADETSEDEQTSLAGVVFTACQDKTISAILEIDGTTCPSVVAGGIEYIPRIPESLQFYQELTPQHEGAVFLTQPKLRAYDSVGVIEYLGIMNDFWQMTATIKPGTGHADAILGGTVTVDYVEGWFNFTDLTISHAEEGYVLEFDITKPTTAADLNILVESAEFDVEAVPLKAGLYAMTSDDIIEDAEFSITLELRDGTTDQPLENIAWRSHTFNVECGLPDYNEIVTVSGNLNKTFDETTGRAQFDEITLSGYGPIHLECHVVSTPAEFDFSFYQKVFVLGTRQVGLLRDTSEIIVVRFLVDFTTALPSDADKAQLEYLVLQDIAQKHPNTTITDATTSEGSILITFTVEGSSVDVTAMTTDLCTSIADGQSYTLGSTTLTLDPYMSVDGQDYYGATCGASDSGKDEGLHPGYIALIVVVAVVVLAAVIIILVWKFKVMPKTKTHELTSDTYESTDNGKTVYLGRGWTQEGTFISMKTGRDNNTLFTSHANDNIRKAPTPDPVPLIYDPEATTLTEAPSDTRSRAAMTVPPRAPSPIQSGPKSPSGPAWRF